MSKLQRIEWVTVAQAPRVLALVLAACVPALGLAQQQPTTTPGQLEQYAPAKEQKDPNLTVTLKFITDKLNQQGIVNVAGYMHDNATGKDRILRQSFEQTNVRFDRHKGCKLLYHKKVTTDGNATADGEMWLLLRDVGTVDVIPKEQGWKLGDSKAGNTTWSYRADPSVFVMRLNVSDGQSYEFEFYDQEMANRVAKAMIHAIDMCGGVKEAF
jgi:hypothetical protein